MVEGYGKKYLKFTYKPSRIGQLNLKLQVYFDKFQHSPEQQIHILGECVDVPIYIDNPEIDL